MTTADVRRFIRDARRATGAIVDSQKSVALIVRGDEKRYYFDGCLTEKNVLRFLTRQKVAVHREDEMRRIVLFIHLVEIMIIVLLFAW